MSLIRKDYVSEWHISVHAQSVLAAGQKHHNSTSKNFLEFGIRIPLCGAASNKTSSAVLSPSILCNVSFNNVESVIFSSHLNMMRCVCNMFIKARDGVYLSTKSQVTCRGGYSNLVSPLFQVLHVFRTDFKRMSALFGMSFIQHPQIKLIICLRKSGIRRL